jgi:hypothetical protein
MTWRATRSRSATAPRNRLVWNELNQHTLWTAGQLVANFRNHTAWRRPRSPNH